MQLFHSQQSQVEYSQLTRPFVSKGQAGETSSSVPLASCVALAFVCAHTVPRSASRIVSYSYSTRNRLKHFIPMKFFIVAYVFLLKGNFAIMSRDEDR